jgi:hypothetical protein
MNPGIPSFLKTEPDLVFTNRVFFSLPDIPGKEKEVALTGCFFWASKALWP